MRLRLRRPTLVLAAVSAVIGIGTTVGPSVSSVQAQSARYGQTPTVGAHCMNGRTPSEVAFVPGYSRGLDPFGFWTVSRIVEDQSWTSSANPDDDFAFLVVHQPGAGGSIQELTGGEAVGIDVPAGQTVQVAGYPDNQDGMISCENTATDFSPTQYQFDCGGFTGGTSGSPLLADVDTPGGRDTVIGVIGGYQQGGDTASVSYAAKFSTNLSALYKTALDEAGQSGAPVRSQEPVGQMSRYNPGH
jgi:V8-like Glu-specific endopeptidase